MFSYPNNWYQSLVPQKKFNSLRKILKLESLNVVMKRKLEMALEDYDVERMKNLKLQEELNSTNEFILILQERLSSSQAKRKELLQQSDDEEKNSLKEKCQKLSQVIMLMKTEMQDLTMKLSKDIEDRKKKEDSLVLSLKNKFDECGRLTHENNLLRTDLAHSRNNEQELERQTTTLRDDLTIASEYK